MTSLKNILPLLSQWNIEIHVFAITNVGENYQFIKNYAKVLGRSLNGTDNIENVTNGTLGSILYRYAFFFVKWIKKWFNRIGIDLSKILFKPSVKKLETNQYDIVIAFQEGQATKYVSLFKNVKKIAWVRCDYSNMLRITNSRPQHKLYSQIDKIICVSEYTKERFISLLPELSHKTIALYNLIDIERIISGANSDDILDRRFSLDGFRIVSLGRIDPVKRFSIIPQIANQLVQNGCQFKWYIIGGKADEKEYDALVRNIADYKMENNVFLLGETCNPYPYIKKSDLVVCTSLSEACPNVINEAKIIHTPIISTNFGSAKEFIINGINGYVEPIERLVDKIEMLIRDNKEYERIRSEIQDFEYDNEQIRNQLEHLLCH